MTFTKVEKVEKYVDKEVEKIVFEEDCARVICTDSSEYQWRLFDVLATVVHEVDSGNFDEAEEWLEACETYLGNDDAFDALYQAVKAYLEQD